MEALRHETLQHMKDLNTRLQKVSGRLGVPPRAAKGKDHLIRCHSQLTRCRSVQSHRREASLLTAAAELLGAEGGPQLREMLEVSVHVM